MYIRRAVVVGGGSTDPKVNDKLNDAITAALKMSVPKETINRTIEKAKNVALRKETVEVMGPGGSFLLVDLETDNISRTRHDLKKIFKKLKGPSVCGILQPGAAKHAFEEKGVIRIKKKVGEETVSFEKMEEIAIEVGAEEIVEDEEEPEEVWRLITAPLDVMPVKGSIERALPGVEVLDAETRFLPIMEVPLSEADMEQAATLCNTLQEMDEVTNIYDNIK